MVGHSFTASIPGQSGCRRSRRRTQTDPRDTNHRSLASKVDEEEEEEEAPTAASVAAGFLVGGIRSSPALSWEEEEEEEEKAASWVLPEAERWVCPDNSLHPNDLGTKIDSGELTLPSPTQRSRLPRLLPKKQTCGVPSHRNLSGRHAPSLHVNSDGEQRGGRGGGHRSSSEPSRQWSTPSHTSFWSRQVPSRHLQRRWKEGRKEGREIGNQRKSVAPVSALVLRAPLLVVALGAVGVAVALPLPPEAGSTRAPEFTPSRSCTTTAASPDFTTVGLVGAVVAVANPVADALHRNASSPKESVHLFINSFM